MRSQRLILASASPQRKTLLAGLGVPFGVVPSALDESACTERDPAFAKATAGKPAMRAMLLARMKAEQVAAQHPDAFVIGCDTLVVGADGTLLEKPVDAADACRMLRLHSGAKSTVHSGLCVLAPRGKKRTEDVSSSHVWFKKLSKHDIDWWIATNQWKDRSGGFQIDGQGQLMIERIDGDWTSIVGLPVFLLGKLLKEAGYAM